ncbi:MAG: hypothetical protein U0527_02925 [Candidatus Eisenbacteria bacterium]
MSSRSEFVAPSRERAVLGWFARGAMAALLLFGAREVGGRFEAARGVSPAPPELALFPTGPWVKSATLGRARLAADAAWLESIQYYGRHRKADRRYPFAQTLFTTLVGLDPRFENAYVFGALVLAEDVGRFDQARALLEQGIAANPESWRLRFELGFLCYLHGPSKSEAAMLLRRAAETEGAPESVARLAAFAATRGGDRELAVALWTEVYRATDNAEIQRIALQYLHELGAPSGAGS